MTKVKRIQKIVNYLQFEQREISVSDIANALELDIANTSRLISQLEQDSRILTRVIGSGSHKKKYARFPGITTNPEFDNQIAQMTTEKDNQTDNQIQLSNSGVQTESKKSRFSEQDMSEIDGMLEMKGPEEFESDNQIAQMTTKNDNQNDNSIQLSKSSSQKSSKKLDQNSPGLKIPTIIAQIITNELNFAEEIIRKQYSGKKISTALGQHFSNFDSIRAFLTPICNQPNQKQESE